MTTRIPSLSHANVCQPELGTGANQRNSIGISTKLITSSRLIAMVSSKPMDAAPW